MKRSNKLLLLTALLPLIFISVVHFSLYAKYKSGDFVTEKQEHTERYDRKELPAPVYLSIKGIRSVYIVSSDTFAVEYPKEYNAVKRGVYKKEIGANGTVTTVSIDEPELHYLRNGDTLTIVGYDSAAWNNSAIEHKEEHSFPSITLFCRGIRTMAFEGADVNMEQEKKSAMAPDSRILLKGSGFAFGNPDADQAEGLPHLYETIRVQAENSKLDLNTNVVINNLELTLDSLSSVNDHSAQIGHLDMHWSDRSQIQLSGSNLRKLQAVKP